MDPKIDSALDWFRCIYLDGIPRLLQANETSFLSFLCVVAATDALAGYRYTSATVGDRFRDFVTDYFPPEYKRKRVALPHRIFPPRRVLYVERDAARFSFQATA